MQTIIYIDFINCYIIDIRIRRDVCLVTGEDICLVGGRIGVTKRDSTVLIG